MKLKLESNFKPSGDQPTAIKELINGLESGQKHQTLLGATGTGKTFTIANVVANKNKTTLVLSHNKTLAGQLYSELKQLFPNNKVEYFISYFDYYRPEAYMPQSDTYIDKTSKNNWDIESMRMSTLNSLLTRKDTIVVASVAAIYGQLSPKEYIASFLNVSIGDEVKREDLLFALVRMNYNRNDLEISCGIFRAKGDVIEIGPSWTQDFLIRIELFGNEIEKISLTDFTTGKKIKEVETFQIFPATAYTTTMDVIKRATVKIKKDLEKRLKYFKDNDKLLEHQRLSQRCNSDIESLLEFGVCPGIENYSWYLDGRKKGEKPFTLLDYLPKDSLLVIDESHIMLSQLNAMYNGDRSRKQTLVDYGFRLPAALDNRPLKFEEFENYDLDTIYVSATPSDYEIEKSNNEVISQIVRPTGLLDPTIEIVPTHNQIEDIYNRVIQQVQKKERTFIITTTKRMAEELSNYLRERKQKVSYLHSEHKTFERDEILRKLRKGIYDVVVGVNLIREGIDIPEVSLMLVLQADFSSFFRSTKSLIQIIGRVARNVNGHVVLYGDKVTMAMQGAIDETDKRRKIQIAYNEKYNITPKTIVKPIPKSLYGESNDGAINNFLMRKSKDKKQKQILVNDLRRQMLKSSKELNFERAAQLRDLIIELKAEE